MTLRTLLLILLSVSLSGFAQVAFKFGVSTPAVRGAMAGGSVLPTLWAFALSPGVIAGLAMYGVGTLVWLSVLAKTELSLAYPFVGLSFLITALFGALLFHEAVTATRLLGAGLVVVGIVLIASR